jgi:hypothetical protein
MDPPVLSRLCGQPSAAATVRAGLQPGQFPASDGAAPSGASLDLDDIAGETDQDRGQGRAPFPADRLPDGGSGGSARVVPGDSGRDWAVAIGSRGVRMKADHGENTSQQRRRCLHVREKKGIGAKNGIGTAPVPEKSGERTGKLTCKTVEKEENHESSQKQIIYAMNNKSNGKSRLKTPWASGAAKRTDLFAGGEGGSSCS